MPEAARQLPLSGLRLAPCAAAALTPMGPRSRFLLQGPADAAVTVGVAFGVPLPMEACRAAEAGERAGLWLGPEEWLLTAPPEEGTAISLMLAASLEGIAASLVDIGHRQTALLVEGPAAADILAAGCPLDLDEGPFPVGACTRTVLGKAEIVLWRRGAHRFHIEVWRSFAAYVAAFLDEARREHA